MPPILESSERKVCPELSDEALMESIVARQPWALDQLHARYGALLHKIVATLLPNQADAEETVQDIFTEIWRRVDGFDPCKGKPLGWIICIARRRAIDHLRKIRSRTACGERFRLEGAEAFGGIMNGESVGVAACDDPATASDLRRFLRGAIGGLPIEQGHVVNLTFFQAMSQREIARHTGIPLGTIKTRLELGLHKLLHQLQPLRQELSCKR